PAFGGFKRLPGQRRVQDQDNNQQPGEIGQRSGKRRQQRLPRRFRQQAPGWPVPASAPPRIEHTEKQRNGGKRKEQSLLAGQGCQRCQQRHPSPLLLQKRQQRSKGEPEKEGLGIGSHQEKGDGQQYRDDNSPARCFGAGTEPLYQTIEAKQRAEGRDSCNQQSCQQVLPAQPHPYQANQQRIQDQLAGNVDGFGQF